MTQLQFNLVFIFILIGCIIAYKILLIEAKNYNKSFISNELIALVGAIFNWGIVMAIISIWINEQWTYLKLFFKLRKFIKRKLKQYPNNKELIEIRKTLRLRNLLKHKSNDTITDNSTPDNTSD
jgi:uncharacterized membrane protein